MAHVKTIAELTSVAGDSGSPAPHQCEEVVKSFAFCFVPDLTGARSCSGSSHRSLVQSVINPLDQRIVHAVVWLS